MGKKVKYILTSVPQNIVLNKKHCWFNCAAAKVDALAVLRIAVQKLWPQGCQAGAKGQGQQRFHNISLFMRFELFSSFYLQIADVQFAVVVSNVGCWIITLPLFTMDRKIRNHGEKLHCKTSCGQNMINRRKYGCQQCPMSKLSERVS